MSDPGGFSYKGVKMITEGYFAQIKNYPETDELVCVSLKYPGFVKSDKMFYAYVLAPYPWILKRYKDKEITWERYAECYLDHLEHNRCGQMEIEAMIERDTEEKTIRLMCWEKALDKKCHRFLLLGAIQSLAKVKS